MVPFGFCVAWEPCTLVGNGLLSHHSSFDSIRLELGFTPTVVQDPFFALSSPTFEPESEDDESGP